MNSDQPSAETGRPDAVEGAVTREIETAVEPARRIAEDLPVRRRRERRQEPARQGRRSGDGSIPVFFGAVAAVAYVVLSLADGGFAPGTWAAAGVLVWWSVLVSILARAWPSSSIPVAALVCGLALAGLTALTAASMAWASDAGAAFADAIRALGYLGVFVLAAIACRAGIGRALLSGVAAGLVVLAAIALLSRLEPGFAGGVDETLALEVSGGRLSYPLGYWNALGACMALALVLCVWLGAGAATRGLRALALASTPIVVLSLFFSGSRGGVLAAAAGLATLLLVGPRRVTLASVAALGLGVSAPVVLYAGGSSGLVDGLENAATARDGDELLFLTFAAMAVIATVAVKRDRWLAGLHLPVLGARRAVTALVIIGVLGTLVADPAARLRALDAPPGETQISAEAERTRFAAVGGSGRVQFWGAALDAARSAPLRGIGAGGFHHWWSLNGDLDVPVTHAHSLFLESAAELGIFGALMALLFFAPPVVAGIRSRLQPTAWADPESARGLTGAAMAVLGAGLLTAAIEWTWDIPSTFVPVVIAVALLTVGPARGGPAGPAPGHRLRRGAFGGAAVLVAVGATVACGVLYVSEVALEDSRTEIAADKPRRALDSARRARGLTPFSARPYEQIAIAERARGRLGAAKRAIDEAEERAELDWRLWWIEAGIDFESGRIGEGFYNLNHAEALNPLVPERLFLPPSAVDVSFYREVAEQLGLGR